MSLKLRGQKCYERDGYLIIGEKEVETYKCEGKGVYVIRRWDIDDGYSKNISEVWEEGDEPFVRVGVSDEGLVESVEMFYIDFVRGIAEGMGSEEVVYAYVNGNSVLIVYRGGAEREECAKDSLKYIWEYLKFWGMEEDFDRQMFDEPLYANNERYFGVIRLEKEGRCEMIKRRYGGYGDHWVYRLVEKTGKLTVEMLEELGEDYRVRAYYIYVDVDVDEEEDDFVRADLQTGEIDYIAGEEMEWL